MNRLLSVDALRGATIAAMILVNNPGDWGRMYAPLRHAEWHGWTVTDLIFPFFLFLVGVSIVLALQRRLDQGMGRGRIAWHVARRAAVLFALGLFLAGFPFVTLEPELGWRPELARLRWPGVLQRIAICFLVVSVAFVCCRRRTLAWLCAACLVLYHVAMLRIPVPGHGPGRIDGKDTHLAAWVDQLLLSGHMWVQTKTWDPEGVLSTIPAVATTLFGVFAGFVLVADRRAEDKVLLLLKNGALLVLLGYVWDWWFPINKNLWSSSYAVFTAGQACCALGLAVWFVDVRGHVRAARPFVVYGVNAITVFVLSGMLARSLTLIEVGDGAGATLTLKAWLYRTLFESWLGGKSASLGYALGWLLGWYALLAWMHRRRIVIRV